MGRRSTSSTKSGKFMNPTDQASRSQLHHFLSCDTQLTPFPNVCLFPPHSVSSHFLPSLLRYIYAPLLSLPLPSLLRHIRPSFCLSLSPRYSRTHCPLAVSPSPPPHIPPSFALGVCHLLWSLSFYREGSQEAGTEKGIYCIKVHSTLHTWVI